MTRTFDYDINYIKKHEGFRSKPYQDSAGVWTIGYGSTYTPDGKPVSENMKPITEETATQWLDAHLRKSVIPQVNRLITNPKVMDTQGSRTALYSLVYNIGSRNFAQSRTLVALNDGDMDSAAEEWKGFNQAGGRVVGGLQKRREDEIRLAFAKPLIRQPNRAYDGQVELTVPSMKDFARRVKNVVTLTKYNEKGIDPKLTESASEAYMQNMGLKYPALTKLAMQQTSTATSAADYLAHMLLVGQDTKSELQQSIMGSLTDSNPNVDTQWQMLMELNSANGNEDLNKARTVLEMFSAGRGKNVNVYERGKDLVKKPKPVQAKLYTDLNAWLETTWNDPQATFEQKQEQALFQEQVEAAKRGETQYEQFVQMERQETNSQGKAIRKAEFEGRVEELGSRGSVTQSHAPKSDPTQSLPTPDTSNVIPATTDWDFKSAPTNVNKNNKSALMLSNLSLN